MQPTVIDLFAGGGLMGHGFAQAGFRIACSVDNDANSVKFHKLNFPNVPIIMGDVRSLSGNGIRQVAKVGDAAIDVLIGGPPCQPFSCQGLQAKGDRRRTLVAEYVRLVGELQPRFFVMENVKGLTNDNNRPVLDEAIAGLKEHGYQITPWRVLDAQHYGVAQHRERLFLLGARRGEPMLSYPDPHTSE